MLHVLEGVEWRVTTGGQTWVNLVLKASKWKINHMNIKSRKNKQLCY